jgi:hypothetical protein
MCRSRFAGVAVALLVGAAALPATAASDGLPLYGVDVGNTGIATHDGVSRYVTLPAGKSTVVARVEQDGGRISARRTLDGRFTIPAVAYDGSADGLSRDGSTLVLIAPRTGFPRARTTFAVLDALTMRLRTTVRLPGDFSFDAISPDGETVYLVNYLSPRDPTSYAVRAYDVTAGRLLPKPIVDPTESDEAMGGTPVTREASPDGRWAYTLYERGSQYPFIHALDTMGGTARCIDLELLPGSLAAARLQISPDGASLRLVRSGVALAEINTSTFESVSYPQPAAAPAETDGRNWAVPAIAGGVLSALVVTGLVAWRRRLRLAKGVAGGRVSAVEPGREPPDALLR